MNWWVHSCSVKGAQSQEPESALSAGSLKPRTQTEMRIEETLFNVGSAGTITTDFFFYFFVLIVFYNTFFRTHLFQTKKTVNMQIIAALVQQDKYQSQQS